MHCSCRSFPSTMCATLRSCGPTHTTLSWVRLQCMCVCMCVGARLPLSLCVCLVQLRRWCVGRLVESMIGIGRMLMERDHPVPGGAYRYARPLTHTTYIRTHTDGHSHKRPRHHPTTHACMRMRGTTD
jgi:hypothetical protein